MATDILSPPSLANDQGRPRPRKTRCRGGTQLVSIVIPCCGMMEYTKMCVASILKHTRMPYELIFLDIGSLDGTEDYLDGLKQRACTVRVEVVRTPTDLGIPQACREALEKCRGEFVVLLNNDTIVTSGWVIQLISLMNTSPAMGMVGPMSNYANQPQMVQTFTYRSGPRKIPRPARIRPDHEP